MCIAIWYYDSQKFILLFNREEYFLRPTKQLGIINEEQLIIGGLDLLQGGTWLAVNIQTGIICFLTNRSIFNLSTYQQMMERYIQEIRFRIPRIMNNLYTPIQSRGKLIMQLVSNIHKNNDPLNPKLSIIDRDTQTKYVQTNLVVNEISDINDQLAQARLNSYKYIAFNLFLGSIVKKEFKTYSSLSQNIKEAEQIGSASSLSNIGESKLKKQQIAETKFKRIIQQQISQEQMVEELFKLAQEDFKSDEQFFKAMPNESQFFIPPYGTGSRQRGTRTTTLVISQGTQLLVSEKTYQ